MRPPTGHDRTTTASRGCAGTAGAAGSRNPRRQRRLHQHPPVPAPRGPGRPHRVRPSETAPGPGETGARASRGCSSRAAGQHPPRPARDDGERGGGGCRQVQASAHPARAAAVAQDHGVAQGPEPAAALLPRRTEPKRVPRCSPAPEQAPRRQANKPAAQRRSSEAGRPGSGRARKCRSPTPRPAATVPRSRWPGHSTARFSALPSQGARETVATSRRDSGWGRPPLQSPRSRPVAQVEPEPRTRERKRHPRRHPHARRTEHLRPRAAKRMAATRMPNHA